MDLTTVLNLVMWGGFGGVILLMIWNLFHVISSLTNLINETKQGSIDNS